MRINNFSIAIFDSGIGGLSIWQEVKKLLPKESLIYFADQAFCPYGTKSPAQIQERVCRALEFLVDQKIKMAVIACNTATTVGIDEYRKHFPFIPIVGVVPVIKTAVRETSSRKVLVLATQRTINNHYVDQLIKDFGGGVQFYKVGDKNGELVKLIETGKIHSNMLLKKLESLLKPFCHQGIDVVVLGCTHFPFIKQEIQIIMGNQVQVLDSGGAVARQVKKILTEKSLLAENNDPKYTFYTTGDREKFINVAKRLIEDEIQIAEAISVKRLGL